MLSTARVARVGVSLGLLLLAGVARAADAPIPPANAGLAIRITSPAGGQTSERVVTVRGTVAGTRASRITLVVNGLSMSVPVQSGAFEQPQVLSPGANSIRALVTDQGRAAEDVVALHASVPRKDLRITMTWDSPATDVDLWVTGPDGEKVFYGNRQGKGGGTLDTDVTTGFGPETYTQARLARGTYRVEAHAYSIAVPTRVVVTTIRWEGTPEEERRTFKGLLLRSGEVAPVGEFVE